MVKVYLPAIILLLLLTVITFIYGKKKKMRWLKYGAYLFFLILLVEFTCLLGLKIKTGNWLYNAVENPNTKLFEPHPYLVAVPRISVRLERYGKTYTHNSLGIRGQEIKPDTIPVIVAIGGSTTYGTNVSDNQTWPYYLDSLLHGRYKVLNCGVPGYSTVEMIIQSAFIIPQFHPEAVIIYAGLNDMRNAGVPHLMPDYSGFHSSSFAASLGFCDVNSLPSIASLHVLVKLMQQSGWYPECEVVKYPEKSIAESKDIRIAMDLYERNLHTLINIYKARGVKVILVPQVLCSEAYRGEKLRWWIPWLDDAGIEKAIAAYNRINEKAATENNVVFTGDVLKWQWTAKDFIDPSHFNAKADRAFAEILLRYVMPEN